MSLELTVEVGSAVTVDVTVTVLGWSTCVTVCVTVLGIITYIVSVTVPYKLSGVCVTVRKWNTVASGTLLHTSDA